MVTEVPYVRTMCVLIFNACVKNEVERQRQSKQVNYTQGSSFSNGYDLFMIYIFFKSCLCMLGNSARGGAKGRALLAKL